MNALRTTLAATAFAVVSSSAFAADTQAVQPFGRDSVYAAGKIVTSKNVAANQVDAVPGRQGGLPLSAKLAVTGTTKPQISAGTTDRLGRA